MAGGTLGFDNMQSALSGAIGTPADNNVGKVFGSIWGNSDDEEQAMDKGVLSRLGQSLKASANQTSAQQTLGQGFYNSPPYIAMHYTNLGKFFNSETPGNFYTNSYKKPQEAQPLQSQDPSLFYAKWYNRMREIAQAEEIVGKGQPVRSR